MSGNANIIVIEGRLTKDPTYMKTKNGKSLCKFSVANNRFYYTNGTLQNEVYFFDLVTWGYNADKAAVSLFKGRHVLINGELRQNIYTS
ncbi:single-stranded DNA-binding protein, partial [Brachyspira hampsonii]